MKIVFFYVFIHIFDHSIMHATNHPLINIRNKLLSLLCTEDLCVQNHFIEVNANKNLEIKKNEKKIHLNNSS